MAKYMFDNHIATISICNPPVNALGRSVRYEVYNFIRKAISDSSVKAIIICGRNGIFSAGADITEFGTNKAGLFPTIYDIVMQLESSHKVTLAAIGGIAFGGGLELALGCHYRLSSPDAKFSFPEVKLGILPGAGGTQRFSRVVDLIEASKWITSGQEYSANQAHAVGLVDCVIYNNLLEGSTQFIKEVIDKSENLDNRRLSKLPIKCGYNVESEIAEQSKVLGKKFRGAVAPLVCWHAVLCGSYATYDQGILFEKRGSNMLGNSDQSRALIYAFFSERNASKWKLPGGAIYQSQKPLTVESVGVVGLGTMGCGIAVSFIRKVCIRVDGTEKKIFSNLDAVCKPSTIFATNTSTLDIDQLAQVTKRPEKVVGMHFFAPAHLMPLLENIYGKMTSPEVLSTVMHVGKTIGKKSVLVGNCHGFVGNRMYATYRAESDFMLEEGASPQEIDTVLCKYGFPMGRYQVSDLSGNDVGYKIRQSQGLTKNQQTCGSPETIRNNTRYSSLADFLVEAGRYGYKSNWKGWYDYVGKPKTPTTSPFVTKMISDYRSRNGFIPRKISEQEILERMLYPLINEGFRILEEGIATRPSDIDVVWLNGYAWPRHTGGPMYYAHTVGLPHVLDVLQKHWSITGPTEPHWRPSELLSFLVKKFKNPPPNEWLPLAVAASGGNQSLL